MSLLSMMIYQSVQDSMWRDIITRCPCSLDVFANLYAPVLPTLVSPSPIPTYPLSSDWWLQTWLELIIYNSQVVSRSRRNIGCPTPGEFYL